MKLIASGVTLSAAIVRSPSFSRSSSSTTITIRPSRIASMASSMGAKGPFRLGVPLAISSFRFIRSCSLLGPCLFEGRSESTAWASALAGKSCNFHCSRHVLADQVALEVDALAGQNASKIRMLQRERDDLHVKVIVLQGRHREADAIHGDRTLVDDIGREIGRKPERQPLKLRLRPPPLQHSDCVDMTLDEVTTKPTVSTKRTLQVHARPPRQRAKRRHPDRLGADIGPNSTGICGHHSQADTVDGQAVTGFQLRSYCRINPQLQAAGGGLPLDNLASCLNEAGEHNPLSARRDPAVRRDAR